MRERGHRVDAADAAQHRADVAWLLVAATGRTDAAVGELREMVRAIKMGDVDGAERAAADHVRRGGAAVLESLEAARVTRAEQA